MNYAFQRLIDMASGSLSRGSVKPALQKFVSECGFKYFTYVDLRDPEHSLITNYPQEWRLLYFEKNFLRVDPVITQAKRGSYIINWDADTLSRGNSRDIIEFYGNASDFGIRSGSSITIPTGFGHRAVLTLASDHLHAEGIDPANAELPVIAATLIHKAMSDADNALGHEINLTPREATCLRWLAEGKSTQEIAELLGISYRSVRFHSDAAKKKLSANTVIQAVAVASRLRLI